MTKPNVATRNRAGNRKGVVRTRKAGLKGASSKKEAMHPLETALGMFKNDPMPDAMLENIRKARGDASVNHAEQEQGRLIGDLPVGRLAGKYKDDPVFAAIMDEIHAATEAELATLNASE